MEGHGWILQLALAVIAIAGRILLRRIDRNEDRKDAAAKAKHEQEFLEQEQKLLDRLEETVHTRHKRKGASSGK